MEKMPITKAGFEKLKKELDQLKRVLIPENIKAIEEARGHGDISENAEYEAAKERQALIEGRINETCEKIGQCEIIEASAARNGKAVFGSTVVMEDTESGEVLTYMLVGPYEADVQEGTISVLSPLGQALIGRTEGDEVRFQAPGGTRCFEILELR